jgi:diguanylate cyclase (GGDEF)-like protein
MEVLARLARNARAPVSWRERVAARVRNETLLGFHAVRAGAHLVIAIAVVLAPIGTTPRERLFIGIAIALGGPATIAIAIFAPPGRRHLAGNLFLGVLVIVVCAVLPDLWGGGIVVLTAVAIGAIPVESRRVALAQIIFFALGMGIVGWVRSAPNFVLPLVAFAVMTPSIERYYQRWRLRRAETNRRLEAATKLIQHQAEHDGLTGLITRNVFMSKLQGHLEQSDGQVPVAVLVVDVHRFQEVNGVLGHRVGDQLLVVLARRFEQLPFAAAAARLGGDEFAFVLVGDEARQSVKHAHTVVDVIEELVQVDRLKLSVSGSVGLAVAPDDGSTAEVLMLRADTAMYRAKDARERVTAFTDSEGARVGEQLELGREIEHAISSGQIEVWFQPKIDLATERIVGAEGLARWRHPDLGVLTPDRFLPLLNITSDYQAFTDEVIRQGIEFVAQSKRDGAGLAVAINLSAMSFLDQGLVDRVAAMLEVFGVNATQVTFEITESDILEDLSVNGPVFERLIDLGVELSIDDFGVGYSSLIRLRELPVQELKIDRSFVSRMESDPEDLIIVKAVVDLANVLGHRSVAEGVETLEAWDRLREMGCDEAQGYLFGRPMPAAELLDRYAGSDGVRRFVLDNQPR